MTFAEKPPFSERGISTLVRNRLLTHNGQATRLVGKAETAGLRIQADTTSGWISMAKRVQLSRWDARDPIIQKLKVVVQTAPAERK